MNISEFNVKSTILSDGSLEPWGNSSLLLPTNPLQFGWSPLKNALTSRTNFANFFPCGSHTASIRDKKQHVFVSQSKYALRDAFSARRQQTVQHVSSGAFVCV